MSSHRRVPSTMRRRLLLAGSALAVLVAIGQSAVGLAAQGAAGHTACRPVVRTTASVPDATAPGGRRAVWIQRPAGPDRADVPVLYLLHGFPGGPADLVRGALPGILAREMCRTGQPFVVAVPDGRAGDTDTEWGDAAAGGFALERFVTTTAIRLVEGTHRRPADHRAIGGFSMGGYGAAALALRHPGLYRQVAAFSGYYHADDPAGVFGSDRAHAPDQLVAAGAGQRYFLVEGTGEDTPLMAGSIRGEADRFAGLLRAAGITVAVEHPAGGHSSATWYPQLGAMTTFLDAGWTPRPSVIPPAAPGRTG